MSVRRRIVSAVEAVSDYVLYLPFSDNGDSDNVTIDPINSITGQVGDLVFSVYSNGLNNTYDNIGYSGTNAFMYFADDDRYSMTNNQPFYVSFWQKNAGPSTRTYFEKADRNSAEFELVCNKDNSGQIFFYRYDESASAYRGRSANAGSPGNKPLWSHIMLVYTGGLNNADHQIWSDNVQVDDLDFGGGTFVDVENLDTPFTIMGENDGTGEMLGTLALFEWGTNMEVVVDADTRAATNRYQAVELGIASRASYDLGLDPVFDMTSNGNGATPQDGSTNAATVTATALVSYDLGVTNAATTYNGSTSKGIFVDTAFPTGNTARTISYLCRHNSDGLDATFDYGTSSSAQRFGMYYQPSPNLWTLDISGNTRTFSKDYSATWHQIVLVVPDSGTLANTKMFYDGVEEVTSGNATAINTILTGTGTIGGNQAFTIPWDGQIDEFKVYNSALTDANVTNLWESESLLIGNPSYWESIPQYDSLVAFYPFNAGESKDWSAVGRGGNSGTDTAVTYAISTGDAEGNGSTSHIDFTGGITTNTITVACWANLQADTAIYQSPVSGWHSDTDKRAWSLSYSNTANQMTFWLNAGAHTIQVPTTTPDGVWMHYAATWDGTSTALYTNGVVAATGSYSADNLFTNATYQMLRFRNDDALGHWDGETDDVLIYDTALTSNEVNTLYGLGHPSQ